jgi:arylsulfatase A-like enzyme
MKYENKINDHGVAGYSDVVASQFGSETIPGFGSHGGLGPHENSSFLFVKNPEELPNPYVRHSSLIDIAPTVLRHLGLPYDGMDGRPLQEEMNLAKALTGRG